MTTAEAALRDLLEGNTRYITGGAAHPNQSYQRRAEIARRQTPRAVVLGCADSRVPPEIIFDQGLGDLFVVRIGGQAITPAVLDTIELAVRELSVPLIVVLGHSRCRATEVALETLRRGDTPAPDGMVAAMSGGLQRPGEALIATLDEAIRANIEFCVETLAGSEPSLAEAVRSGDLAIVGARYDVETGRIEIVATTPGLAG